MSTIQLFCKKIIDNMEGDSSEEKFKYIMNLIEKEYNSIEKPERAIVKPSESNCVIISEKEAYTIPEIITTNCYCRLNSKGFPSQCKSKKVDGEKMCKRHLKIYKDTDIIHGEGMIDEDMPMQHLPGSKKEGKNHCWKCTSDGTIIQKKKKDKTQDEKPKRKQKKCGNCGEYGHMKKTCKVNMNITKIPMKKVIETKVVETSDDETSDDESKVVETSNDETTVVESKVIESSVVELSVVESTEDDIELEKALKAITPTSAVVDKSDEVDYPKVKFNTNINMYKSANDDDYVDDLNTDEENYGFTINGVKYEFEINEDGEKQVINDEYEPVGIWNGEKSCIEWDCEEYENAHKNHEDYISD